MCLDWKLLLFSIFVFDQLHNLIFYFFYSFHVKGIYFKHAFFVSNINKVIGFQFLQIFLKYFNIWWYKNLQSTYLIDQSSDLVFKLFAVFLMAINT